MTDFSALKSLLPIHNLIYLPLIAALIMDSPNLPVNQFLDSMTPAAGCEVENIIVIADVHGDADHLLHALNNVGIWYRNGTFHVPKHTLLVQLGDLADRGPHTRRCYDLMHELSSNIPSASVDGRPSSSSGLVQLFGNHEVSFAMIGRDDPRSGVHPNDIESFCDYVEEGEISESLGVIQDMLHSLLKSIYGRYTLFQLDMFPSGNSPLS